MSEALMKLKTQDRWRHNQKALYNLSNKKLFAQAFGHFKVGFFFPFLSAQSETKVEMDKSQEQRAILCAVKKINKQTHCHWDKAAEGGIKTK